MARNGPLLLQLEARAGGGYLAKRHTRKFACRATGHAKCCPARNLSAKIHGLDLPVRHYRFLPRWQFPARLPLSLGGGATPDSFVTQESARYNLIRAIWNGRGNQGQKIIEFIISALRTRKLPKPCWSSGWKK